MAKFFLGVAVTLAIMYPVATKYYFGTVVDTTNAVVKHTLEKPIDKP